LKISLLPQAQEDLCDITDPILSKILKRIHALRRYPELGAAMVGPFAGYRSTVVDPFRIVYKQAAHDLLLVAYIRHCRRNPPQA